MPQDRIDIYNACKDMPNPSPGLLKLFKKERSSRIWGYVRSEHLVARRTLETTPIARMHLRFGSPGQYLGQGQLAESSKNFKWAKRSRSFHGRMLRQHMFSGRKEGDVFLVGIGHKRYGSWMIDVTEEVVANLNETGSCFLSPAHCKFELISPKVKKCKFCSRKLRKRVKTIKEESWESCDA